MNTVTERELEQAKMHAAKWNARVRALEAKLSKPETGKKASEEKPSTEKPKE